MAIDISNFRIQDLEEYQYIQFQINMITKDIVDECKFTTIVNDNVYCYAEIRDTMYKLQESRYLVNTKLKRISKWQISIQ
jgi:heme oxygenase